MIRQVNSKLLSRLASLSVETVESWKERLPEIVKGYRSDDVWNMDETGIFWRALPDCSLARNVELSCKGGEKNVNSTSQLRFLVSASGNKERPVVIWKSENPRCMQRFSKVCLPVSYYSQPKAWMTGDILDDILRKLNRRLSSSNRNILLLMDNAGCHPENLSGKDSNIKVCFLPAFRPRNNPNFKVHYLFSQKLTSVILLQML